MAPPVQEDKDKGLQCGEMYNCVLPKESRHHPSSDFFEMVGRKPQAGKRVRRGKEKGVYVERCIFGSSDSWLRANLLQIAPSPNAYPQKGPKFGFFCITYSHLGECARKYYNILSRAVFTSILCELFVFLETIQDTNINSQRIWARFWLIKRHLLKYIF